MQKRYRKRPLPLCALALLCLLIFPFARIEAASFAPRAGRETGMAMSTHWIADAVGQKILDEGGNAVDAAVAIGYALAVVYPTAGNIGGGGFAVIYTDGKATTLDFREKAPAAASRDMYLDAEGNVLPATDINSSLLGYKAAGVPGTVKGLNAMLERYGTKPLAQVVSPAIKLAEDGFPLRARDAASMARNADSFSLFESSRKYFLKPDGSAYAAGEPFVQTDLAETLKRILRDGSDGFYKGTTARLIAGDMAANGGLITLKDLADYDVVWRDPAEGAYRGCQIYSMAPPSSGGTHIVQILNVMENADVKTMGFGSVSAVHLMAEAMRYAYADRSEYMGDPDFVDVPVARLTSKSYAREIYGKIRDYGDRARPSSEVKPGLAPLSEGTNTTHYSVVDRWGNAVSVTYTLNGGYGSKASVMGAGFLLNNEMDDFAAKPGEPNMYGLIQGEANAIAPGKRPLSSMSPSIVLKNGKVFLVTGSPGGSTIITTTLQVISNVIDHGMDISEAVAAGRIHMQWYPDRVTYEKFGLTKDALKALADMGYTMALTTQGDAPSILVDPDSGVFYGQHDPRTFEWIAPEERVIDLGAVYSAGTSGGSGGSCSAGTATLALAAMAAGLCALRRKEE